MKEAKEHIEWQRDEIERLRHQCEKLAAAALSNGEDLLRHENEVERLRKALRSVIETWDDEYAGDAAVDMAIREAQKLLQQAGDEG